MQSGPSLDSTVDIVNYVYYTCAGTEWDFGLQVGDEVEVHGQRATASLVEVCGAGYYLRALLPPPPEITCVVPDQALWYDDNVTVPCTASDTGSGLADSRGCCKRSSIICFA